MKLKPIAAAIAAATGATLITPFAWSQQSGGLEEIVVTATRREQNLQDVPIAIVAYTGEMLETQGIENMEDLKAVVPNVIVAGNLGGSDTASFTMRGIPNVGTYIDGIWQVSNNGLLLREFVDLDRVEVLRGPQGTLYGRDSTGGAIRLYTKAPSPDYGVPGRHDGRQFGSQGHQGLARPSVYRHVSLAFHPRQLRPRRLHHEPHDRGQVAVPSKTRSFARTSCGSLRIA